MAEKKSAVEGGAEEEKQQTKIVIDYEGSKYTLEYNRDSIRYLEEVYNFSYQDMERMKLSKLPDLFFCGFRMHHPNMKRQTSDTIFSLVGDKTGLMAVLLDLYRYALMSMFDEPEEGKALTWKAV